MKNSLIRTDHDFSIDAELMRLRFVPGQLTVAHVARHGSDITVHLPAGTDLTSPPGQTWLRRAVTALVAEEARQQLPPRLARHAAAAGLAYHRVCIKNMRSRWGSCSALRNINLSQWLMLLPARHADYVLLHELAHLREMNHGPRFWQTLGSLLDDDARRRSAELRAYTRQQAKTLQWCMAPETGRTRR